MTLTEKIKMKEKAAEGVKKVPMHCHQQCVQNISKVDDEHETKGNETAKYAWTCTIWAYESSKT